jgi:cytochrome b pre-mRNA-processing protein 3
VFLKDLFKPSPARLAGRALLQAATRQARQPAFYADLGAPDTLEGRFELFSLHVALLLRRLKGRGRDAGLIAQALFDAYIQSLDDALREMGVGDLSVGRKMRKLGEAFYGRIKGYEAHLNDPGDSAGLEAMLTRTVFAGAAAAQPAPLADYVRRCSAALAAVPDEAVYEGRLDWPGVLP